MVQRRYYRVAEHLFVLDMPEQYMSQLNNYQPFLLSEEQASQYTPVFTLSMADTDLSEVPVKHLFTDASEEDMPRIEVSTCAEGWLFTVAIQKSAPACCRMCASSDFSKARLAILTPEMSGFAINNALMLLYAFSTVRYATLEMHAAVVVKDGKGYLFLGKSGTGKSTHAMQWLQHFPDSWLLNDDNPIIRLHDSCGVKELRVYGSPWSGKTPCYLNEVVPVGALVKLSQAPHNEARRLRMPEAYAYMMSSASGLKIDPTSMDALYDTMSQIVALVPFFHLDCLPDHNAAQVCYDAVK